jgi:hypothetical protein
MFSKSYKILQREKCAKKVLEVNEEQKKESTRGDKALIKKFMYAFLKGESKKFLSLDGDGEEVNFLLRRFKDKNILLKKF